jgi:Fic family protein
VISDLVIIGNMPEAPWYRRYEEFRTRVAEKKQKFDERCKSLGASPGTVTAEIDRDINARIVRESNWQEGMELDQNRTRELADEVFASFAPKDDLELDAERILREHRDIVVKLRTKQLRREEIAAVNLAIANLVLAVLNHDFACRRVAAIEREAQAVLQSMATTMDEEGKEVIDSLRADFQLRIGRTEDHRIPLRGQVKTLGQFHARLLAFDTLELLHPLKIEHLHLFHRLVLMGLYPSDRCGKFRIKSVNVGNPNLDLPPPTAIPGLMEEFCRSYEIGKIITAGDDFRMDKGDPIFRAAQVSYKFVRIHPYRDGNGRISRLLMNLVPHSGFTSVYLKADKKGRHRYIQSLRRADRTGDVTALAALIAMSLDEIYERLLKAVGG